MADIRIKTENYDLAKRQVREGLDAAIRALAFGVQAAAMDNIRQYPEENRPIDTGALLNSIYVTTRDADGRGEAMVRASSAAATPGKSGRTHSAPQGMASDFGHAIMQAKVAVLVEYGVYVEEGTSRKEARPFLRPAFEDIRPKVDEIVKRHVDRALTL